MKKLLCASATFIALIASGFSANVNWTNTFLVDDTSIRNDGSLLYAYNFGGSTTAVNGVSFVGTVASDSNFGTPLTTYGSNTSGMFPTNPMGYSANLVSLLDSNVYYYDGTDPTVKSFTINGLTAGKDYAIQFLVTDNRSSVQATGRSEFFIGGSNNSSVINHFQLSGEASSVTGAFVADSSSQVFSISATSAQGFGVPLVSAFQVRDLSAVPEASTWLLSFVSLMLIYPLSRRSRLAPKR